MPKELLRSMAKELYNEWLKQQSEPIPIDQQLKFSNPWLKSWCQEYGVSLKLPNKRFSISNENRIERIQEYITNVLRVRIYYYKKFGVNVPIINGDQMPLRFNESRQVHFIPR